MAIANIRSHQKFYLPFLLTIILSAAMYYNMCGVSVNTVYTVQEATAEVLGFGVVILGLFSVIFLFYTNSFLMKRRKQELGLYHVLGLNRRHIAMVLAWETFFIAAAGIVGGLVAGLLLDRMMFLIILRLYHHPINVEYHIYPYAIKKTLQLFLGIFVLLYLYDALSVCRSSAIELLQSGHTGEREPKTKWAAAIAGVVCVGTGYYMANTVENVAAALTALFLCVLLVMAGTYCLFLAGSVAFLKFLKRRKTYYYQTNHFVAVCGLLYRMKQNAVGLANICILSTGVLLVLSTTVCLYAGMKDILTVRFPHEIEILCNDYGEEEQEKIERAIAKTARDGGWTVENYRAYESVNVSFLLKEGELSADSGDTLILSFDDFASVTFLTDQTYEKLTGKKIHLPKNGVGAYHVKNALPKTFCMMGNEYRIAEELDGFPVPNKMQNIMSNWFCFVMRREDFEQFFRQQQKLYEKPSAMELALSFDVSGEKEDAVAFFERLQETCGAWEKQPSMINCRYVNEADGYILYGSMLFLGIYLGTMFLTATVLIIYYKQMMEGYEDRGRYAIMRKVGMDRREIRRCVRSQILILFFLPLGTALAHCLAAFHLMTRVLQGFYMHNTLLFAGVTAAVAGVFTLGYTLVFLITSRSYYQIVSGTI